MRCNVQNAYSLIMKRFYQQYHRKQAGTQTDHNFKLELIAVYIVILSIFVH